jgi:hypothetical protein
MPKKIFIKGFSFSLVFALFFFNTNILYGDEFYNNPQDAMTAYFYALKEGDVQKLISLLTDPVLGEKRENFDEDPNYPDFLRNYYQDATMLITQTNFKNDHNICILTTEFFFEDGGNPMKIDFHLKMTDKGWKISEELTFP